MIVMKREIETPRLVLRPWSDDDLDHLARILANPQVVRYITYEYGPLSRKEAVQAHDRILQLWDERGFGPWAAIEKESGRWVGKIGLNVLENWPGPHNVEVEWQLEPSVWGHGLATEGGQAGVQYGFDKLASTGS
jgi:RimJ/RimL family protein N-acetyltransferase